MAGLAAAGCGLSAVALGLSVAEMVAFGLGLAGLAAAGLGGGGLRLGSFAAVAFAADPS